MLRWFRYKYYGYLTREDYKILKSDCKRHNKRLKQFAKDYKKANKSLDKFNGKYLNN